MHSIRNSAERFTHPLHKDTENLVFVIQTTSVADKDPLPF